MKKILMLALIGLVAISGCKKSSTPTISDNLLHIDVSKVVAPTTYNITLTKGGVTAFTVTGGTENKTYTMPASSGDSYTVTYSFSTGTTKADGAMTFSYNGMNRGYAGVYGSGTTTVTIQ